MRKGLPLFLEKNHMKKIIKNMLLVAAVLATGTLSAQEKVGEKVKKEIAQSTTFGGYVVGKASYTDESGKSSDSSFDLRYARLYLSGKTLDFKYRLQIEMAGAPGASKEKSPRILDAYGEWVKYSYFQVRLGQFKRAFTFENPMNPWDIGFGAYSQLTDKLAGMNDRLGEHSSGGRDAGVQVQGDLLPIGSDKHNFLHYQVGLYNGQGINHSDANSSKDLIGGVYVFPIKELAIGAFGWNGSYTSNGVTVDRNRFSAGLKYESAWTVRAEYGLSKGYKLSDYDADTKTFSGTDKSDAWYIAVGAPLNKQCKVYAKWDVYRDNKEWNSAKSIYALSANYYFTKNLKLQANYNYTYNRAATADKSYNTIDLQLYWRF